MDTCINHGRIEPPAIVIELQGQGGQAFGLCLACYRNLLDSAGERIGHTRTDRQRKGEVRS